MVLEPAQEGKVAPTPEGNGHSCKNEQRPAGQADTAPRSQETNVRNSKRGALEQECAPEQLPAGEAGGVPEPVSAENAIGTRCNALNTCQASWSGG